MFVASQLVSALDRRPPEPSVVLDAVDEYLPLAVRVAATQYLQIVASGRAPATIVADTKMPRPFVWSGVLDNKPRTGTWTQQFIAFDIVFAVVAGATAHMKLAQQAADAGDVAGERSAVPACVLRADAPVTHDRGDHC